MAISVEFYQFGKKKNSTKRPSDSDLFGSADCLLLDPCDILNPALRLELPHTGGGYSVNCNYARIPLFNRYYWITGWTYDGPYVIAQLAVDTLASWKGEILGTTQYVTRSSLKSNANVPDTFYPVTAEVSVNKITLSGKWNTDSLSSGTYVIGTVGAGETVYYALTPNSFRAFFMYLFSDNFAQQLVGSWQSVFPSLKAQLNPLQYIESVTWFPFEISGTPINDIPVGWGTIGVYGNVVDTLCTHVVQTITQIPQHPQISRGNYLKFGPYSEYSVYIAPFGIIPLKPELVANASQVDCTITVDNRTGASVMYVTATVNGVVNTMGRYVAQLGVPIQIAQDTTGLYGLGDAIVDLTPKLAAVAAAPSVTSAVAAVGSIGDMAGNMAGHESVIGSNGSIPALRGNWFFQAIFHHIASEDQAKFGRPLCERWSLATFTGYLECKEAIADFECLAPERSEIENYMNGGFYIE